MGKRSSIFNILAMHRAQELNEWLEEARMKSDAKKLTTHNYWRQRLTVAMDALRTADPSGWEAWYDDDLHVPAKATDREYCAIVEARVKTLTHTAKTVLTAGKLYRGAFIWRTASGAYIIDETGHWYEFVSVSEAEAFVDAALRQMLFARGGILPQIGAAS